MNYCHNCGSKMEAGNFCPNCNEQISLQPHIVMKTESHSQFYKDICDYENYINKAELFLNISSIILLPSFFLGLLAIFVSLIFYFVGVFFYGRTKNYKEICDKNFSIPNFPDEIRIIKRANEKSGQVKTAIIIYIVSFAIIAFIQLIPIILVILGAGCYLLFSFLSFFFYIM